MRSSEFTFKKTVKTVKVFKGLSLDLTVAEALYLRNLLGPQKIHGNSVAIFAALNAFCDKNNGSESP